jgi:hypothetical protein
MSSGSSSAAFILPGKLGSEWAVDLPGLDHADPFLAGVDNSFPLRQSNALSSLKHFLRPYFVLERPIGRAGDCNSKRAQEIGS